jgi:predicted ATPase
LEPRFQPNRHVPEIARRLDGLPLALELAAARVKVLTPAQIAERLSKSLDLLTGGGRDMPERQRTLRATLEWSYELLSTEERRTFARLGIFASSFDLELADAITHADIDSLQSLVDKGLLTRTVDDRFAMLETVRPFAREHLDESSTIRTRIFSSNQTPPGSLSLTPRGRAVRAVQMPGTRTRRPRSRSPGAARHFLVSRFSSSP